MSARCWSGLAPSRWRCSWRVLGISWLCAAVTEATQRAMAQARASPEAQDALATVGESVILYLLRRKGAIEEAHAIRPPDERDQAALKDLIAQLRALAGELLVVEEHV